MDPSITVEEIQSRTYEIWQAEGKPEGMDVKHWLVAEREVLEEVDRSPQRDPPSMMRSRMSLGVALVSMSARTIC
jgi:DUF2934 family protein